jgi:hypothetical protein
MLRRLTPQAAEPVAGPQSPFAPRLGEAPAVGAQTPETNISVNPQFSITLDGREIANTVNQLNEAENDRAGQTAGSMFP